VTAGEQLRSRATLAVWYDVGTMFLMTDPGSGIVIQDVGRVVFDAPFHVSFEAGHHEVLHGGVGAHLDELACNALAGD
jgi:hypothetical protein